MSPAGKMLRVRCRKFPSIINCCTLDWFMSWPEEALLSVAQHFLQDLELKNNSLRKKLAGVFV